MRHKSGPRGTASEKVIKDIRRATRKHYSAEEKIRIVLDGLRKKSEIGVKFLSVKDVIRDAANVCSGSSAD